jgi:cysteine desulfuration protein SufE
MSSLSEIIETFQSVDAATRLDLLLDYANSLPPLPERFRDDAVKSLGRIHECMTPVFLFMEKEAGNLRIFAEVAEEAPTVKGFVSILVSSFDGKPASEAAAAPDDLLKQLGLDGQIRMNRAVGLSAMLSRVKRAAS